MQIVIAGGGVAGLTAALSLARQGHRVRVVDRDDSPRPEDVASAAGWARRGVAQFRQPHAFLSRLHAELSFGLPDVLDRLRAIGVPEVSLLDGLRAVWCRRSTLEWVMRGMAEGEPGVGMVHAAVSDVRVEGGRVTGVRLRDGAVLDADLVVDATGRRGRLSRRWARQEVNVPADEVYTSRRYRTLPGAAFGPVNRGVISVAEGDGYTLLVFPHDAGTFTVCFTRLPDDPELSALRRLPVFEAATRLVPLAAEWTDPARAEPITDVMVMSGLRNTFQVLDDAAPLGLHPLADAVCTTNPHFGRGSSLAVAHALRLSAAVASAPDDPRSWRAQVGSWTRGELRAWFDDGQKTDTARASVWRNIRDGRPPMAPPGGAGAAGPGEVPHLLVLAAAGADRTVGRAVLRHMHMVDPPEALGAVVPRVAAMLADGWLPGRPDPGCTRGVPGSDRAGGPDGAVAAGLSGAAAGPPAPEPPAGGAPAAPPRRELVEQLRLLDRAAV